MNMTRDTTWKGQMGGGMFLENNRTEEIENSIKR